MLMLETEYLSYICQMSLTVNNQLSNLYHQYSDSNKNQECLNDGNCDNELNDFLLELIDAAECDADTKENIRINSLVKEYHRVEDLVRYMHNIDYLANKHRKELMEKSFIYPKLCDYQLEDSRLLAFAVDNQKHTCSITLNNVLLYNDKRKNRNIPVDCGKIVLLFKDTKKVEMKGEINSVTFEVNTVYNWCIMETVDKRYDFGILILVGNRQFELEVNHSDIEVIYLAADW